VKPRQVLNGAKRNEDICRRRNEVKPRQVLNGAKRNEDICRRRMIRRLTLPALFSAINLLKNLEYIQRRWKAIKKTLSSWKEIYVRAIKECIGLDRKYNISLVMEFQRRYITDIDENIENKI